MSGPFDFHTHVLRDSLAASWEPIRDFRRKARNWLKPLTHSLHRAQTLTRHLPEPLRRSWEGASASAPIAGLIFESTLSDLQESMRAASIDDALILAWPPLLSNEALIELCQGLKGLHAAVVVSPSAERPKAELKKLVRSGARALKLCPATDGEELASARYKSLLEGAADTGIPVIIPTGAPYPSFLYKDPSLADPRALEPWFKRHPSTRFVLGHMNFKEPGIAFDLAETFENVHVDTSWQPAEVIAEAVRRLGSERVLFASDWPFVGDNQSVALARVREAFDAGLLGEAEREAILGGNARRLLSIGARKAPARLSAEIGAEIGAEGDAEVEDAP